MDSILESYRSEWAPLVEPDDWEYSKNEILPDEMQVKNGHTMKRIDFTVMNPKQYSQV